MENIIKPALKIRDLSVSFVDEASGEKIKALDIFDLDIEKGEVYGIFGRKNSGKTTLLNVLNSTVEAESGLIEIFGESHSEAGARLKTGYFPAEPEFEGYQVARSILQRTAYLNGVPENRVSIEIDRVIEETSLSTWIMKKVKTFTEGQLRRLTIAASLLTNPELLLIDDPSSGIGEIDIVWMTGFIDKLKERNKTVLICSSQMTDIEKHVDKFRFMESGLLTDEVDISELKPPNTTSKIFEDRFGYLKPEI